MESQEMFGHLLASRPVRQGRSAVAATVGSLIFHGALGGALVWATMAVGQEITDEPDEQITFIQLEEEPPPPPPPPPPPEVRPPVPAAPVAQGFQTLAIPEIVPPDIPPPDPTTPIFTEADFSGRGVEGGRADGDSTIKEMPVDIAVAPIFTPMTVAPVLRNRSEVERALTRFYPPVLRDAGIGGSVLVWFFIDETGKVVRTQLKESSGYDALDQAALQVAEVMEFQPAINHDEKVKVWVSIPIRFDSK